MAGIKISQLPIQPNANTHPGDSVPIVDSAAGELKQITLGQLDLRYQGVPNGGTTQQLLAKASGTDKDVYWKSISKTDVGLGQVDNTSDVNKPISTATQNALNLKANTSALNSKADTSYVNTQLGNKQDKLPNGTDGEVLTLVSGAPQWRPSGGGPGAVTSVFGRTGNVTAQVGDYDKTMIGLDQVDNTSDLDKPISNLTQTALNGKEPNLPSITGNDGKFLGLVAGSKVWVTPPTGIPNGGTTGQALVKASNSNGDVTWTTIESGLTVSSTQTLSDGGTITIGTARRKRVKVQGNSGAAKVTIPNGSNDGEELYVQGMNSDSPITIENSGNVVSNGDRVFVAFSLFLYIWDSASTKWIQCGGY